MRIADDQPSKIIHVVTGQGVDMPAEMQESGFKILKHHSEATAYFKGKFSDPLITRIFGAQNATLPKPDCIKKITDFVDNSFAQDLLAGGAADQSEEPISASSSEPPPLGHGGTEPPSVGST